MAKYYDDLTLEEMFEQYDHTYMMADDHRAYENGRRQREIWSAKVEEQGGWTKELVETYNKYAPGGDDDGFKLDWKLIHTSLKQNKAE
tara:strand:+ start:997 stop:1260 length:264 start_codon:yes stop_codon:yes gene_type:complete